MKQSENADFYNYWKKRISEYLIRIIVAFLAGLIMIVFVYTLVYLLLQFLIYNWIPFFILPTIPSYFIGYIFGKKWPELSWGWGLLINIPWFIITFGELCTYGDPMGCGFGLTIGSMNLLGTCIGAYFGAKNYLQNIRWKEVFSLDSPAMIALIVIIIFLLAYVIFKT